MKTLIQRILDKADEIFEYAWSQESDNWKTVEMEIGEWNRTHDRKAPSDELSAVLIGVVSEDQLKGMYNRLSKADYNRMKTLTREMHDLNRKGLDKFLSDRRSEYFEALTAKLTQAISKHLTAEWNVDENFDISLSNSEKGYTIFTRLISEAGGQAFLETSCIPAGGWNIQVFHYRYRSNFKVL